MVETHSGTVAEAEEIRVALVKGTLRQDQMIELGSRVTGVAPLPPNRPTVFRSVGHAVEDLAVANAVIQFIGP